MGCLRGANLGEPNREVWEKGIRKLIQKTANQNGGSPGGLRGASGLPKGLRSEDKMVKGRRRDVAEIAVGNGLMWSQG